MKILQELDDDLDLRSGDWQVLDAFHDLQSNLAFQGLKRKLGMHQETLSRALHRLESDHLVERTEDGYRLTRRGSDVLNVSFRGSTKGKKVLETYLPTDVSTSEVISRLKYSWFSTLRWLGISENGDEAILTWLTEDGSTQVRSRFNGNRLVIEIAPDSEASNLAIKSAHELISRIIREYRSVVENLHNPQTPRVTHEARLS